MTDFRPVRRLLAYSGGTVPDSDRIHYSPPVLNAKQAALEQYMKLRVLYTRKIGLSIIKSAKRIASKSAKRIASIPYVAILISIILLQNKYGTLTKKGIAILPATLLVGTLAKFFYEKATNFIANKIKKKL